MVYPRCRQGTAIRVVAPGAMLPRQADHQGLELLANSGTPWSLTLLGTITLLGHELPMPAKNRVRLDDRGPRL